MDAREILTVQEEYRGKDGAWYISIQSTDHEDHPIHEEPIRADVIIAGWIIEPVDPSSAKITYL